MNKLIKRFIMFFLLMYIIFSGGMVSFAASTISEDINAIDETLYPDIKARIQELQIAHPSWKFKLEYIDMDWNEAIVGEHQGHKTTTSQITSMIHANNSKYAGLWICEICNKQVYDTGAWHCASVEALEYMMDARNSVNETDLFQFLELSSEGDYTTNEEVKRQLTEMAANTNYLDEECINAILSAATKSKVDPYYLMAKIIQEQGYEAGSLILGNGYNGLYTGVYNFYNFGASGEGEANVIKNGLAYAASQNWTSKTAAIEGGAELIAKYYIAKGQDTLYYQKFNVVVNENLFDHQFQQNILAAQSEGTKLRKLYMQMDPTLKGNYVFTIPLYKNMPSSAVPRPSTTEEHKTNETMKMGDLNLDGSVNIIDAVVMIEYLNGRATLSENATLAAKVSGGSSVSIIDAVRLIEYLNGNAVLVSENVKIGTLIQDTNILLSPNGTVYKSLKNGTSFEILKLGSEPINNSYWDLVITSNGRYGYISRNSWK